MKLIEWSELEEQTPGAFISLAWELLEERDDKVNISHQEKTAYIDHARFVQNHPYRTWLAIMVNGEAVGTLYLTRNNEIGIFILKEYQGQGIAKEALQYLLTTTRPLIALAGLRNGNFVAHVNPNNQASIKLFESLGAKHISNTYQL